MTTYTRRQNHWSKKWAADFTPEKVRSFWEANTDKTTKACANHFKVAPLTIHRMLSESGLSDEAIRGRWEQIKARKALAKIKEKPEDPSNVSHASKLHTKQCARCKINVFDSLCEAKTNGLDITENTFEKAEIRSNPIIAPVTSIANGKRVIEQLPKEERDGFKVERVGKGWQIVGYYCDQCIGRKER